MRNCACVDFFEQNDLGHGKSDDEN
jgi:hypothetical protein